MNLQSDNVGIKRPQHSLSPIRIEELPDEILIQILSLLHDAAAYRTRILSKRWNHLCFFLPSLCFKMPNPYKHSVEVINKFYDFVDETLSLRNRDMPVIKRFFLSCSTHYDHNRVLHWVCIVLDSKLVQALELRFPYRSDRFSLSLDLLMTCNNTLVDLTLKDVRLVGLDETQLLFPCLKRLKLESIEYSGDESPLNMISASPVLQELFLVELILHSQLPLHKISSTSLKRLIIQWCDFEKRCKVVIDAPELEYICIRDYSSSIWTYSLTNLSSLVEAHINKYSNSDIQLLTNVSSAKFLTLGKQFLLGLSRIPRLNMPVFPNFVKLIVDFDDMHEWDILNILLKSMPNLQHITIEFGEYHLPFIRKWNQPTGIPSCLRFMVKEILILKKNTVQVRDDVTLISYLLKHSSVLEKLTLNSHYIDREKREKLLNIPRCSKSCQIEFV